MRKNNKSCNTNTNSKYAGKAYSSAGKQKRSSNRKAGNSKYMDDPSDSAGNDPSWYAADAQLLRDAASIPYSWATGTKIDLNNPTLDSLPNHGSFTIPGVCVVNTVPSIGWTEDPTSATNVAANSIYTWIRSYNSGSKNYDAPDLMLYLLSVSQFYSYINWLQRLYGVMSLYSSRNRYFPKAIVGAMHVDFDDLESNMANFRYYVNTFINKVASLAVPNTIEYFKQQAFMYKDLYIEGSSIKDQVYFYNPLGFWRYKLNTDGSGMLEYAYLYSTSMLKLSDLIAYGNKLLSPVIGDEDFNIMSGDIVKAYGNNIIKLGSLPEMYPIVPVYNLTVLEQMKNATCIQFDGSIVDTDSLGVRQSADHSCLIHKPMIYVAAGNTYADTMNRLALGTLSSKKLTTTSAAEADPSITIENTRLMIAGINYNKGSVTENATIEIHGGAMIPVSYSILRYAVEADDTLSLAYRWGGYGSYINLSDTDSALGVLQTWSIEQCFKFHPMHYEIAFRNGSTSPAVNAAQGFLCTDIDNYAVLTNEDLVKLHDTAMLNMLFTRPIAKS